MGNSFFQELKEKYKKITEKEKDRKKLRNVLIIFGIWVLVSIIISFSGIGIDEKGSYTFKENGIRASLILLPHFSSDKYKSVESSGKATFMIGNVYSGKTEVQANGTYAIQKKTNNQEGHLIYFWWNEGIGPQFGDYKKDKIIVINTSDNDDAIYYKEKK